MEGERGKKSEGGTQRDTDRLVMFVGVYRQREEGESKRRRWGRLG